jgi:DNA recombination protein RmuC
MELLIYIAAGIIIGGLIVYVYLKSLHEKHSRSLQDQITHLQKENARKFSQEEINQAYVARELYNKLTSDFNTLKSEIDTKYTAKTSFDLITQKLKQTEETLSEKEKEILSLNTQLTQLRQKEAYANEKLAQFKNELDLLHQQSQHHFRNLANEILEEKKKNFIETNKNTLASIIDPLKTNLKEFKEKVEATRKEDIADITSLKKEIEKLHELNTQLSDDAQNLANALKSDIRIQGTWGEDRLKLILEAEGLQKYIDYKSQEGYRDEEEILRKPDFILHLPNGKHIIIDSKVSLTAYVDYFNAIDPEEKAQYLRQHIKSLTDHIDSLADKNYQALAGINSPDYVFMFVPIEPAVTLALNERPDLFNRALSKKIVIITPTTFVATLKVIKIIWQKENQVKNVQEIFKQCGLLYDKFVLFLEQMIAIGKNLDNATHAYKDAMDRLKDGARKGDTILGRFETIKKLEAKTTKQIPAPLLEELNLLDEEEEKPTIEQNSQSS